MTTRTKVAIAVGALALVGFGALVYARRRRTPDAPWSKLLDPYENYDFAKETAGCIWVEKVVNQQTGETIYGDRWYCGEKDPPINLPGYR